MAIWRYGDTNPVVLPIAAATVAEIGDLLFLENGQVKPATLITNHGSEAANQKWFHDHFAGVAMQKSRVGDDKPIRVATTGVFDFDMPSATVEVGDLLGTLNNSGGAVLEKQKLKAVNTASLAIGRCAKRVPTADTRVLVDILATVSHGGPQNPAT